MACLFLICFCELDYTLSVTDFEEQRFVIQQKLLEAFLSAIQTEIDSIS